MRILLGQAQQISSDSLKKRHTCEDKALLFVCLCVALFLGCLLFSLSRSEKIMNTCDMTTFRPQPLQRLKMFGQDPEPRLSWLYELPLEDHVNVDTTRGGVIKSN